LAFAALLCLAFHGGWPVWRFAALRTLAPSIAAVVLLPAFAVGAALAAAATLPAPVGAVAGLYLLSRLLLDLPGSVTPGWWGAPVLLAGSLASVLLARRGATADNITAAVADAGLAMAGLAGAALGVALLARAADLPPLTALAVGAALLLTLVNALTGALLGRAAQAIGAAVGTNDLARLGGLLRRMPGTGLALLLALASTASVPLTPGFAGTWLMLQALLGAARLGGTAILALIAAAVAASGLVLALLAGNALRLAGLALLGAPRCAAAAAAAETTAPARLPMAALGLAVVALGIIPAAGLLVVQPGIRLLAGVALSSSSVWGLAAGDDAPGYAAIGLAALLIACTAAAARLGRTATVPGPAWRGGLAADGPAALNTLPVVLWPAWKQVRLRFTSRTVLLGLTLLLAVALGWAAR
jgi:formate hydrogenlyase subunit 3/multisubunit Na+/H+ antiporter MnhD subunit